MQRVYTAILLVFNIDKIIFRSRVLLLSIKIVVIEHRQFSLVDALEETSKQIKRFGSTQNKLD